MYLPHALPNWNQHFQLKEFLWMMLLPPYLFLLVLQVQQRHFLCLMCHFQNIWYAPVVEFHFCSFYGRVSFLSLCAFVLSMSSTTLPSFQFLCITSMDNKLSKRKTSCLNFLFVVNRFPTFHLYYIFSHLEIPQA